MRLPVEPVPALTMVAVPPAADTLTTPDAAPTCTSIGVPMAKATDAHDGITSSDAEVVAWYSILLRSFIESFLPMSNTTMGTSR